MIVFPNLKKSFSEIENIWTSEFGINFFNLVFYIIISENFPNSTEDIIIPKKINGKFKNAISRDFFKKYFKEEGVKKINTYFMNELGNSRKKKNLAVIFTKSDIKDIENGLLFCIAYFKKLREKNSEKFEIFKNTTFKWTLMMKKYDPEEPNSKELTEFLEWYKNVFVMNKIHVPTYLFCKNYFYLNLLDTWKIKITEISSNNIPSSNFFYSIGLN